MPPRPIHRTRTTNSRLGNCRFDLRHDVGAIERAPADSDSGPTVISTFGAIWRKRSTTLAVPMSGEHSDQMAPMLAVARNATTVSAVLGR